MFRSAASPVADVFKFETVVPVAAKKVGNPERKVRLRCCDIFRQTRLLERIIPSIEEMLAAGEVFPPEPAVDDAIDGDKSVFPACAGMNRPGSSSCR